MSTRSHCWTLNNPTHDDEHYANKWSECESARYVIFRREKSTTGTIHLQGYVEWKKPQRYSALYAVVGKCHAEKRRGTREQARNYCIDVDKAGECLAEPQEIGQWNNRGQGNRTDCDAIARLAMNTNNVIEIMESNPGLFMRHHRGIEKIMYYTMPKRTRPPQVILHYGPTRTGKTFSCFRDYPSLYKKSPDTRWFDGYHDEEVLLMDDFVGAPNKMSLSYLLQFLDQYPFQVEVKGGYKPLLSTTIVLTTNIHPSLWYDYNNRMTQYAALAARFHEVWYFKGKDEAPLFLNMDTFFHQWFLGCDEPSMFETVTRPNTPEHRSFAWDVDATMDED